MRTLAIVLLGAIVLGATACAPVQNQRGYVPNQEAISSIEVALSAIIPLANHLARRGTTPWSFQSHSGRPKCG